MLLRDRVGRLLSLGLFGRKICQGLGLDDHLWYIGYIEAHKLECPLGDPSYGETVPDNFSKPKRGYRTDWVAFDVVQELALCN
jgi:hypothetical protein